MTRIDIYYNGNHYYEGKFEAVPRVGEYLYIENAYYEVAYVWHDLNTADQIQVEIDITDTPNAKMRN